MGKVTSSELVAVRSLLYVKPVTVKTGKFASAAQCRAEESTNCAATASPHKTGRQRKVLVIPGSCVLLGVRFVAAVEQSNYLYPQDVSWLQHGQFWLFTQESSFSSVIDCCFHVAT